MNNRYDYTSDYSKILELSFYHEFFRDTSLVAIDLIPDIETQSLLKNYNLLQRKKGNSFIFLKNNNSNLNNLVFSGPIQLVFRLKFNDPLFLNITDIPFGYQQKIVLEPSDDNEGRLHPMTYVDPNISQETDENGVFAEIKIAINENNEFFGYEEQDKPAPPKKFFARFNSRTIKFRYNFYSVGKQLDFSNFFIYDEIANEQYNTFFQRTLENGMNVFSFVVEEELKMCESYKQKLYLKKEDEFNKSFNRYLSHPIAQNLKFESEANVFYLENFIKID